MAGPNRAAAAQDAAAIIAQGSVRKVRGALIYVEDLERCARFYRDVVGLRMLYRTPRFIRFDATEGTSIALIAGGHAADKPKDYRSNGAVPEIIVDNLSRAMKRVTAADARHEPMVYTAWGRFCIFFDPEGNALQFYESAFVRPDEDPDRING